MKSADQNLLHGQREPCHPKVSGGTPRMVLKNGKVSNRNVAVLEMYILYGPSVDHIAMICFQCFCELLVPRLDKFMAKFGTPN